MFGAWVADDFIYRDGMRIQFVDDDGAVWCCENALVAAGDLQRQASELLASASADKKELHAALEKMNAKLQDSKVIF